MSFNKFKSTVQKLADLSWPDLRDLFSWPSISTIEAENPNLLIAKAANERGETIAFVSAEPILLVEGCVLNPHRNTEDDHKAGASLDAALAQNAGVNRMFLVIPAEAPLMEGEKSIRVFEQRVYQPVSVTQPFDSCDVKQQANYLN